MRILASALIGLILTATSLSADPIKELSPLAPFIGTWKTTGGSVDGTQSFEDVSRWQWAFGGKIVKITHSVNQGAYFGESLISWDGQQQKIVYRYVNNAGFYTDGVITPVDDGIEVHEFVRGSLSGPTETLSGYRVDSDGLMQAWSKFKADGKWGEATTVSYAQAPNAEPIFKD
jgi:hypothetical protein